MLERHVAAWPRLWRIGLFVLLFLVLLRLALPTLVKTYVNHVLANDIAGYRGSVNDVDLSLWRGAYQLQGLRLDKVAPRQMPVPFLNLQEADLAIAWRPLLRGRVVGSIWVRGGSVNFVNAPSPQEQQLGVDGKNWQATLDKLFPLKIERLRVQDFSAHFLDYHAQPKVDVRLSKISLWASNLSNVVEREKILPASAQFRAELNEGGVLEIGGSTNIRSQPQAFDVDVKLVGVDLRQLNPFFKAYANFDVTQGSLQVYAEAASREGNVKGYVKPFFQNVRVLKGDRKVEVFREVFPEVGLALLNTFIRRYSRDESAAKIPFEGRLDKPEVGVWAAIWSLFGHAFGEPIPKGTGSEISVKSVPAR